MLLPAECALHANAEAKCQHVCTVNIGSFANASSSRAASAHVLLSQQLGERQRIRYLRRSHDVCPSVLQHGEHGAQEPGVIRLQRPRLCNRQVHVSLQRCTASRNRTCIWFGPMDYGTTLQVHEAQLAQS